MPHSDMFVLRMRGSQSVDMGMLRGTDRILRTSMHIFPRSYLGLMKIFSDGGAKDSGCGVKALVQFLNQENSPHEYSPIELFRPRIGVEKCW